MDDFETFLRSDASQALKAPPIPAAPAAVSSDPFETFLRQQSQQQTATAAKTQSVANAGADPAAAASAAQVGNQIGVPQAVVEADPQRFQEQAIAQRNSAIVDRNPVLAQWVAANPDSARIARDEYDKLGTVEQAWQGMKDAGYSFAQGLGKPWNSLAFTLNLAASNVPRLIDVARGDTAATDWWYRNFVDPVVQAAEALQPQPSAGIASKTAYTLGSLASTLSQISLTGPEAEAAPAAAGALSTVAQAARQATGSMAFPALTSAVETGHQVLQAGAEPGVAARAAVGSYLLNTMQGIIPLSAPGGLISRLATGFASGAVGGEAQRSAMNLLLPEQMRQPFGGEDLMLQGLTGAIMGGVLGPRPEPNLQDAIRKTYTEAAQAEHAERAISTLGSLGDAIGDSQLRKADPAKFREFVESVADGSDLQHVYVDGNTLAGALAQSKVDLPPNILQQLGEARATGGDVAIPVADYLTHVAGSDLEKAILPHLKAEADGPTFQEAQGFYQRSVEQMQQRAQEIAAKKAEDTAWQDSAQKVNDKVLDQLNTANRFTPDVNKVYASFLREFYSVQADRLGMKPDELFEKMPLNIAATDIGGLEQSAGGQRGMYLPSSQTVALLKDADLSTFLHETGHFYMDALTKIASAPEAYRPDTAAVKDLRKRQSVLSTLLDCLAA